MRASNVFNAVSVVNALCVLLSWGGAAATAETKLTFDDAKSVAGWTFQNGPEFPGATGSISWEGKEGHEPAAAAKDGHEQAAGPDDGHELGTPPSPPWQGGAKGRPGCLALNYSFAKGGTYVQAAYKLPAGTEAGLARLFLKKPMNHRITFRVVDANGRTFQKSTDYTSDRWQQVEVDLTTWAHSFGGSGDAALKLPLKQFAILVENSGEPREGRVLVDALELLPARAGHDELKTATYDALGDAEWRAYGGNTFRDGVWQYAIDGERGARLATEFSLLGRPAQLRLVVESDGSGHAVNVSLGSHFQNFDREIGKLTAKGEQVFEAPLDEMSSWSHHGGENDGERRLPLRVTSIYLKKGDGPASGNIKLKRLEVVTRFAENEAVVLIPTISGSDEQPQIGFTMRNLRPEPAKGRLICEFRSLGSRLDEQTVDVNLPGGARPVTRQFKQTLGKTNFIEASARWVELGFTSSPVSIGAVSTPEKPQNAGLQPESVIGAGLYLYRWRHSPNAFENIERTAALAEKAGVKWSREEILWDVVEPKQGQFEWGFYDRMIEIAHSHGISIYGLLDYWSDWTKPYTEESVEQYCAYARQVVRRYKDRIHHWEIWNEPNIFFWSGPKELYAKLLAKAYDAIKAEDPTAEVMGCSTAGIDTDFIKKVTEWGGKFDALTIHPYRGDLDDLAFMKELQDVKALVGGKPVWLTEIGFPSQLDGGWSERNQASLVARVYLATLASGAARNVSWYDFRNDGYDPFYNEYNFGVVRHDFRPKPAYRALATLGRKMAGMAFKERIEAGADAYAFRFTGKSGDVAAVCAPRKGRLLAFESDAKLAIVNGMEEPIAPVRVGNAAVLTLDKGFPVYISGPAGFALKIVKSPAVAVGSAEQVRPGDKVTVKISGGMKVARWDLSFGWSEPKDVGGGQYELSVPERVTPGSRTLQAVLENGLRLPINVSVQPAVVRV